MADRKLSTEDEAHRERLRRQILCGVDMFSDAEVAELLGLSCADHPPPPLGQTEQILQFCLGAATVYPAFQFDAAHRRVHPEFVLILRTARAAGWIDLHLLSWMMRPHLDIYGTRAAA